MKVSSILLTLLSAFCVQEAIAAPVPEPQFNLEKLAKDALKNAIKGAIKQGLKDAAKQGFQNAINKNT